MMPRSISRLVLTLVLVACGEGRNAEHYATPGMDEVPGMSMRSDSLMPAMRAQLDSLAAMPSQPAAGTWAAHDAMASQMLDAMGGDMRMMGMTADSAWTALADSVRRDLAELPALSGSGLESRRRSHIDRLRRLLDEHEAMMH